MLPAHDQHHAKNQGNGRERGRLEEAQPHGAGGVDIQQADDLAGNRGADVCADDDAERLVQRQDTRGDKAGRDDDHRRRRLNECGD